MDQVRNLRVPLRVVFYVEGESWVAHCLEFDLVGDGSTKEEAIEALSTAIAIQVGATLEFENPANLFTPADGEFFQRYAEGVDVADGEMTVWMNRLRSSLPIIESVEAREYTCREAPGPIMA